MQNVNFEDTGGGMNSKLNAKQIIWKHIFTIFVLCFVMSHSALIAGEKITIAAHNYSPYYNQDAKGMMTEVYQAAFGRVGVDAVIEMYPIKRGLTFLFSHAVDAFSPGHILMDSEMKKKSEWVNSFIVAMVMIYHKPQHKQEFVFNSMEDLRGRRIACLVNSPYLELYRKHGVIVYQVQTPHQMIQMVRRGNVEFYVNTLLSGLVQIQTEFPDEAANFDYFIWNRLVCSLAVSKTNPNAQKWLALFREGLARIKDDGTYIRIHENYWGKNNIPKAVLFNDLESFGVDRTDTDIFHKSVRNSWGRIVE